MCECVIRRHPSSLKTFPLGLLIPFRDPQVTMDRGNRLHALFMTGPQHLSSRNRTNLMAWLPVPLITNLVAPTRCLLFREMAQSAFEVDHYSMMVQSRFPLSTCRSGQDTLLLILSVMVSRQLDPAQDPARPLRHPPVVDGDSRSVLQGCGKRNS